MDTYVVWVNLAHGESDLALVDAVNAYLGYLKGEGLMEGWSMRRRKLGFGPSELGEFQITMEFLNLAQMDRCHDRVAQRSGDLEVLHAAVYSRVKDYRSGLYRDFPDASRLG